MLVIHDTSLADRLRKLAALEHRPVEVLLTDLLDRYGDGESRPAADVLSKPDREQPLPSEGVRRVRRKAYAKARQYWESVGDVAKAAMTDDELDTQFGRFDEEGVPLLKSELTSLEPPVGSLAYLAQRAREANIHLGKSDVASNADDILNEEFAEYLLNRMKDEHGRE